MVIAKKEEHGDRDKDRHTLPKSTLELLLAPGIHAASLEERSISFECNIKMEDGNDGLKQNRSRMTRTAVES